MGCRGLVLVSEHYYPGQLVSPAAGITDHSDMLRQVLEMHVKLCCSQSVAFMLAVVGIPKSQSMLPRCSSVLVQVNVNSHETK